MLPGPEEAGCLRDRASEPARGGGCSAETVSEIDFSVKRPFFALLCLCLLFVTGFAGYRGCSIWGWNRREAAYARQGRHWGTVGLMSQTKCWTAWAKRGFPAGWIDRLGARNAESRVLEWGVRRAKER